MQSKAGVIIMYLYSTIYGHITKDSGTYDKDIKTALKVLKRHNKYGMPSFGTVELGIGVDYEQAVLLD